MGKEKIKRQKTEKEMSLIDKAKNKAVNWVITALVMYRAIVDRLSEKEEKLKIDKKHDRSSGTGSITFTAPISWFEVVVESLAMSLDEDAVMHARVKATEAAWLLQAIRKLGIPESRLKYLVNQSKGTVAIQYNYTHKDERVRICMTIESLLEARNHLNRVWYTRKQSRNESSEDYTKFKKSSFKEKARLWKRYEANMMLNLLMGNVLYDDNAKEQNQLLFVKKTYRTNRAGKKLLNGANEWQVLATAEMTGRAKFGAPVLHKPRISVIDDKGRTLTRADQAKERIGCGDRGHMDWDEINNIAIKKNVAKISYPMLNTILAPQPCFPAELASVTIVEEKLLKCEVRNNINLKTLLGSATGSFFAQDSQGIDEEQLTHLRHLVRGFGVYTGSRSILFIDDVKQIPKQGFDMTTAEKTPKEGSNGHMWQKVLGGEKLLDTTMPKDDSQKKDWERSLSNMVSNPIHQAYVKFSGAGVTLTQTEVEGGEHLDFIPELALQEV